MGQRICSCITQPSAMTPPSVPKGGELATHTHTSALLYLQPACRFMVFIHTSEDTLTTSVCCWCLLSGWTYLSVSLARWKHCLLFRGSIRPTSSTSAAHTAGIMQTETHPNSNISAGDWLSVYVCAAYSIYMYSARLWLSTCIRVHKHTCESVEPHICSRADLRDCSSKQQPCPWPMSVHLFCACFHVWSRIKFLFVYMDLEGSYVHSFGTFMTGVITLSFLWRKYAKCPLWYSSRLLLFPNLCRLALILNCVFADLYIFSVKAGVL